MSNLDQRDILIWLHSLGINNRTLKFLIEYYGDLRNLLKVDKNSLANTNCINENYIYKIVNNRNTEIISKALFDIKENNITINTIFDKDYPTHLLNIDDYPLVLYQKGKIKSEDELSIGIVGARKATAYGKWACEKFTKELVKIGVTIVSGLALGIDTVAHSTALKENGRTIAVLGNGFNHIYPKRNETLYKSIPSNGALISEFPLDSPPLAYNFPQRNRLIAGLSLGIVVIEAKEKSGSLITAHHALEQGKEVFALPGNINSIYSGGTNKLIKDGAKSLLELEDILEDVSELKQLAQERKRTAVDHSQLSETESFIVEALSEGPIHCDNIASKTNLPIRIVSSTLTILEMKGIIKCLNNQIFTLN